MPEGGKAMNSHDSLADRLQLIEGWMEEERNTSFGRCVRRMMQTERTDEDREEAQRWARREKFIFLALYALRIQVCLAYIAQGERRYEAVLRKDWEEVIGCVQFVEHQLSVTDEVVADTADLVLLPCPDMRAELLAQLPLKTRFSLRWRPPLSGDGVEAGFSMSEYYLRRGLAKEGYAVVYHLVELSQRRNDNRRELHRNVVATALWFLVENNPALAAQIGDEQQSSFAESADRSTCRFYWFYAASLSAAGRCGESLPLYQCCYELCQQVEGPRSWIGAKAGAQVCFARLSTERAEEAEAWLRQLIENIDGGFYAEMDGTAEVIQAIARYLILDRAMSRQQLQQHLPELRAYLDYCRANGNAACNPLLTVRASENILCGYDLEIGDFIQAAEHATRALETPLPEGLAKFPEDAILQANLLQIYTQLNDMEKMQELCSLLHSQLDQYREDKFTYYHICLLVLAAQEKLDMTQTWDTAAFRSDLMECHRQLCQGAPEDMTPQLRALFALYMVALVQALLNTTSPDRQELRCYQNIIQHFLDRPAWYQLSKIRETALYQTLANLEWSLGDPQVYQSLERCLKGSRDLPEYYEHRVAILYSAAVIYHNLGEHRTAQALASEALDSIASAWQKAVACLDDHQVCQMLTYIQIYSRTLCWFLRQGEDPRAFYEQFLRLKDLPALAIRERSRVLRLEPVDGALRDQILQLQDQLAAARMHDDFLGGDTTTAIVRQLQEKQAQFARTFPQNLRFTEISFQRMCQRLPEGTAVLEYCFIVAPASNCQVPDERDALNRTELELFLTCRTGGGVQFAHWTLPDGAEIAQQTEMLVELYQAPDDLFSDGDREALRATLYRALLAPAMPYLSGVHTLYIAPDGELNNLPFELLSDDGSSSLSDRFQVCRLISGRDLLFEGNTAASDGGCFALGDPDYDLEQDRQSGFSERNGPEVADLADPLPFSGMEAELVARRCGARPYTGRAATKYALQQALPCQIIHLATHGAFDDTMQTDSLYSSYLLFAGYNRWVIRQTELAGFGNGLLTADEISRLDLGGTELVVLSACQSGMTSDTLLSLQGLLPAFAAAGVRWIVSHIWQASDLSTPVLMDAFYDAYLNKGYQVPDALQYAKDYLRQLTVGDLRRAGWLDPGLEEHLPEAAREALCELRRANDRRRPFRQEWFWGGFICNRCRL